MTQPKENFFIYKIYPKKAMKQVILFLTLLSFIILSCKTGDDNLNNTCNVANPIEDLAWLKEKIIEYEQTRGFEAGDIYISQTNYKDKTVFILGNCCAACNSVLTVYDCLGNNLGYIGGSNFNINMLNNDTVIWSPPNFICL